MDWAEGFFVDGCFRLVDCKDALSCGYWHGIQQANKEACARETRGRPSSQDNYATR
jgi:hypothetical protein